MAKRFKWKLWGKKVGISAIQIIVLGLISYTTNDPNWMFLVPVLEGGRNILKHKYGFKKL